MQAQIFAVKAGIAYKVFPHQHKNGAPVLEGQKQLGTKPLIRKLLTHG
jgi:hypothetical protein